MKVAVVTPYYKESLEELEQCHVSVVTQTSACTHVMVADGFPRSEAAGWKAHHLVLPVPHHDVGSTPRLLGAYHAIGLGFDAVAFLDADNWYRADHVERLVRLHEQTGAAFLSSGRVLCRIDGSVMAPRCHLTDPERFIDTSCMLLTRDAFPLLQQWVLMPAYAHSIGDRAMLHYAKVSGVARAHSPEPTVFYRCTKSGIYRDLQEAIPPGVTEPLDYDAAFRQWEADGHPPLR